MSMHTITVLSAALFASVATAGEIDGTVRDRDGAPVARATVTVAELGRAVETDAHGHFHVDDVPAGSWLVEASAGAATAARRVEVADGVATVALRVDAPRVERIVVRASPLRSRSPLETARPVTVLAGDELTRKSAASIGETIAGELGVSATSFGPGSSRPVIRGLGDDRVRMLQDGIGTLDVSSVSDDHGVTIEPILVDQVEILRGPATLLYGGGAIGGVVNVIDNRIPEQLPAHALEGRAEVRGATATGERSAVFRLDGGASSFAWHVDAYRRATDDIDIPGFAESAFLRAQEEHEDEGHDDEAAFGTLPNSDIDNRGGAFGLSWVTGRGFVGASLSVMDNAYGIPGGHAHHEEDGEGEGDEEAQVRIAQEQRRFDVAGGLDDPFKGFTRLRFRLGVNDYEHRELEGAETGTVFTNDGWEGRVELGHAPVAGGWEGALGLQVGGRDFAAVGDEAFTPPVETGEFGAFWVEERAFERFRLELGGRIDRVRHEPEGAATRAFTLASVSTALIRPLTDAVEFTLNAGRQQRAPVAEELFSDGAHLATGAFELGDAALGRETSKAVEIGLRDQHGDLRWSVSVFRNRFDAFIYQADTGAVDAETGLPVFQYAQRDARFRGIEAELEGTLVDGGWGRFDARVFGDGVSATLADGTRVPRIPPRRYGLSLEFARDAWFARAAWTHHARQDRVAPHEAPTPGYQMLDVDLNYRVAAGRGDWLLFVRGTNLLDEDARRHASFLKEVAPLPGRSVQVGARVGF